MDAIQTRGRWGLERDAEPSDVDLPLVEIPNDIGLSLIMKAPSGWAYANQTGGHACIQAWAEGILVPIGPRGVPLDRVRSEERLDEVLGSFSKYQGHCDSGIDESDANQIDAILSMHWENYFPDLVRVDRSHLDDSWEAWVHVIIGSHPARDDRVKWPFYGLPVREAVLTWSNSD